MRSMMKKREREKKRSRAHITTHASPGKPRLIITIALPSLLFSEEEQQQRARYYKTTKHKIEREENDESTHRPLTSKLFALNPFDAGVANANDDSDVFFSPETFVVSLVSAATTTLTTTPGVKATTHNAAAQKAQNTTKAPHLR